jgi:2C-methyl-D-erythritol 2,4-cyclodiphosphate synthase
MLVNFKEEPGKLVHGDYEIIYGDEDKRYKVNWRQKTVARFWRLNSARGYVVDAINESRAGEAERAHRILDQMQKVKQAEKELLEAEEFLKEKRDNLYNHKARLHEIENEDQS